MIEQYLGIDSDYIILGLAALMVIILILWIVNIIQIASLKKKYRKFMSGKDARSLEEVVKGRIDKISELEYAVKDHQRDLNTIFKRMKYDFCKFGLVKYDAFHEMGGKLSFSLAMLNDKNNGYIINAMHSREGCYTYIKEVIDGDSVLSLSEEEKQALEQAKTGSNQ